MKKEELEKRINELIGIREQMLANANACGGAIEELRRLLIEIDKEELTKNANLNKNKSK